MFEGRYASHQRRHTRKRGRSLFTNFCFSLYNIISLVLIDTRRKKQQQQPSSFILFYGSKKPKE
jgi:hypothetical protein